MLVRPPTGPDGQGPAPLVRVPALDLVGSVSTEFLYSRASPLKERPQTYRGMQRGMGLDEQVTGPLQSGISVGQVPIDLQYSYTTACDLSTPIWQKGPDITTFAPGSSTTWAPTFGFEIGGALYGLAGRYVLKRISDGSWSVSKDLGSGKAAVACATFFNNAASAVSLALVAVDTDKAWWFDGTTWTQFANFTALAFLVDGQDLYWAHDVNLIRKANINALVTNEANYSAGSLITVGDQTSSIVSLAKTINDVLLILKTDAVYTLDANNIAHPLWPNLAFGPGADNGKVVGYFENDIYATYGQSLWRISPDLAIENIGPDRTLTNSSPVHGRITAFCGVGGFFGHAGIYNNTDSYLMKFGGFEPDSDGEMHRIDAWHGSLSTAFASKMLRSLMVSSIGAPSNHTRTYAGFDDGSIAWWTNPCTPNPIGCTDAYRWTTTEGYIYLPRFTGANVEDMKALHSVSGMGPNLNATNWFEVEFKTDVSSPTWIQVGHQFNRARDKVPFPDNTFTAMAAFRVAMQSTANTSSPQVSGVSVWHAWRPDRVMDLTMTVRADAGQLMRNGSPLRLSPNKIKGLLERVCDSPGSVDCILPTGDQENVCFLDMTQNINWDTDRGGYTANIQVRGVSFQQLPLYGTWDRLVAYSWDDLLQYDWDELTTL